MQNFLFWPFHILPRHLLHFAFVGQDVDVTQFEIVAGVLHTFFFRFTEYHTVNPVLWAYFFQAHIAHMSVV